MIEQSSGGEPFEREALRAVERWKYLPATEGGVPVERAVKTIIRFQIEGGGGGQIRGSFVERASAAFVKDYQQLVRLVERQDFEGAAALLAAMEAEPRLSRYETAFLWWAKYVYLSRTSPSDLAQMRRALERAVGSEEDMYLSMDQFVAAAERLVVLHAQASDIAAAMATFERLRDTVAEFAADRATAGLRAVPNYTQSVAALQPGYEAMQELVQSDRLMAMNGSVGEFDYWVHDLLRRSFSFADIKGRLDALDIRCQRGRRRYDSVSVRYRLARPGGMGNVWNLSQGRTGRHVRVSRVPAQLRASHGSRRLAARRAIKDRRSSAACGMRPCGNRTRGPKWRST
jgi:hypothetical protein